MDVVMSDFNIDIVINNLSLKLEKISLKVFAKSELFFSTILSEILGTNLNINKAQQIPKTARYGMSWSPINCVIKAETIGPSE